MSVAKIINLHYGLTISTEIKKLDGEEGQDEAENEPENGENQSLTEVSEFSRGDLAAERDEFSDDDHEIDENKYTPMMYEEIETLKINNCKLIKNGSMDDVFIFEKVFNDEINSLLFIHSCVPQIKEFYNNLKYNQAELTSPYMKEFENLLAQLVFFTISTESKDPFHCDGYPNKRHQKYLREIKIIDLLIDIIIVPFEGEHAFIALEDLTQKSPMTKIC